MIDGELTADLLDPGLSLRRRNIDRATILSVPALDPGVLGRTLQLLESLGIGVTAIHKVDDLEGDVDSQAAGQDAPATHGDGG
ncbi:hypothetical protein [Terrabacter lapilli]|uniref:hypothetical protein n=1 Tax=Terrabacter lapilli TaxID=436231 RepID=UPI0031D60940